MLRSVASRIVLVSIIALSPAFVAGGADHIVKQERGQLAAAMNTELEATALHGALERNAGMLITAATGVKGADIAARQSEFGTLHTDLTALSDDLARVAGGAKAGGGQEAPIQAALFDLRSAFNGLINAEKAYREQAALLNETLLPAFETALAALTLVAFDVGSQELIATVSTIERESLKLKLSLVNFRANPDAQSGEDLTTMARSLRDALKRARSTFRQDGRSEAKAAFNAARGIEKPLKSFVALALDAQTRNRLMTEEHAPRIRQEIATAATAARDAASRSAEESRARARQIDAWAFKMMVGAIGSVILIVAVLVTGLSRNFNRINRAMKQLAGGSHDIPDLNTTRRDEFGAMAQAIAVFRDNAVARSRATVETQTLTESVDSLVESVISGDLSVRLDAEYKDAGRVALAERINRLVTVVDDSLGQTRAFARGLAQGDLSIRIEGDFQGAFAELQTDLNTARERLSDVIGTMNDVAAQINQSSDTIAVTASTMARQTENQAQSIRRAVATMQDISEVVQQNATAAKTVNRLSAEVSGAASDSGVVVSNAVLNIREISETSKKINAIIGLVEGIAFQTKLLALNASVEAARAGSAGSGFAVVAVEVRELAERSAAASSQIQALIQSSDTTVKTGVTHVEETQAALEKIEAKAKEAETSVASITSASLRQATDIEQVGASIFGLEAEIQSNASMAAESAHASSALKSYADRLVSSVSFFGKGGGDALRRAG